MKREILNQFKVMFENERKRLVYSHGLKIDEFSLGRDDMLDDVDMSSTELETSMRMRLRNREALFVKKIDESLARIAEGSFGICECCSEDIEVKRLEARPTSTQCVACKEDSERREFNHIDGHRSKSLGQRLRLA